MHKQKQARSRNNRTSGFVMCKLVETAAKRRHERARLPEIYFLLHFLKQFLSFGYKTGYATKEISCGNFHCLIQTYMYQIGGKTANGKWNEDASAKNAIEDAASVCMTRVNKPSDSEREDDSMKAAVEREINWHLPFLKSNASRQTPRYLQRKENSPAERDTSQKAPKTRRLSRASSRARKTRSSA